MLRDKDVQRAGLKIIPWCGVAAPLTQSITGMKNVFCLCLLGKGHAFCFLPLPAKTTLPVHINGYFELSQNRRDIWYAT